MFRYPKHDSTQQFRRLVSSGLGCILTENGKVLLREQLFVERHAVSEGLFCHVVRLFLTTGDGVAYYLYGISVSGVFYAFQDVESSWSKNNNTLLTRAHA